MANHLVILKDGAIVQQGEPQSILLNPGDPYIEDFVSDINRARVLRVKSIMEDTVSASSFAGDIEMEDNLESVIALSGGDTGHTYRVVKNGEPMGQLDMKAVMRALVPRAASGPRRVA